MTDISKEYKSKKLRISYNKYIEDNTSNVHMFLAILGTTRQSPVYLTLSMFKLNKLSIGMKLVCYRLKLGTSFSWGDHT